MRSSLKRPIEKIWGLRFHAHDLQVLANILRTKQDRELMMLPSGGHEDASEDGCESHSRYIASHRYFPPLFVLLVVYHSRAINYWSRIIILWQTKSPSLVGRNSNIAHKRIQGGVQADISLRVTSNFTWTCLTLTLHRCKSKKRLPFRVEIVHHSKEWSKDCDACILRSWNHKRYTSVRVQFCKEYYGQQLEFRARFASVIAKTQTPIVITKGIMTCHVRSHSQGPSATRSL